MIYTVTFNPSLDYIVTVEHLATREEVLRVYETMVS